MMKLKIATVFTLALKTRNHSEVSEIKGQSFGELTVMSWDCLRETTTIISIMQDNLLILIKLVFLC